MDVSVWSDGGVIWDGDGKGSRSKIGGTYAFVIVEDPDVILIDGSGVIDASLLGFEGTVTNNVSELYALTYAIMQTPEGAESYHFFSDSEVTLGRVFGGQRLNGVPDWLYLLTINARKRLMKLQPLKYTLVGGHPTKDEMKAGKTRSGLPCSQWNVMCDTMCGKAGESLKFRKPATV